MSNSEKGICGKDRASAASFGSLYLIVRNPLSEDENAQKAYEDTMRIVNQIIVES